MVVMQEAVVGGQTIAGGVSICNAISMVPFIMNFRVYVGCIQATWASILYFGGEKQNCY